MDEKQHDKQHCGTGRCPRCHELNESAVPFLFVGLAPGWTLTITDSESKLWFQTTLARGSEVTGRLPICEILTFQLDRTGARSATGKFYAAAGVSLDLSRFTKAKEPDPPSEAYGTCYACGKELLEVADFNSTFFKDARRDWCETHNPGLDEPLDATADALRREGCVWAGVTKDGVQYWEHDDWRSFGEGDRVKDAWRHGPTCSEPWEVGKCMGLRNFVSTPKQCADYRKRGLLTRMEPEPAEFANCHRCGKKCDGHTNGPDGPRCFPCTRGETSEGAGDGATPTKREKAVVEVVKEAAEKLAPVFAEIADYVKREKVWGDMMTDREAIGPILTCGKPGHVTLHLERLSDDREKAMKQLSAASEEMAGRKCRQPIRARGTTLRAKLLRTRIALKVGWPLAPYLQAIRDAHEAIGIEREWQAGKVEDARDCTAKGEFATVKITGAGWRFA